MSRMVSTSSRLVTGLQAEETPNPAEGLIGLLQTLANQVFALQRAASEMTTSLQAAVRTGSRIFGGDGQFYADEESPNFGEAFLASTADLTHQLDAVSNVLRDLNSQFVRMFETSTRLVTGLQADDNEPSPADTVFKAIASATQQFQVAQRILHEMSSQISRMVATSAKVVSGNGAPPLTDAILDTCVA